MTFREMIEDVNKWSIVNQLDLFNKITFNITIGIRSVLSYKDEDNFEKLEAIKWINEFHHRIENLKSEIQKLANPIETFEEYTKYYGGKNKITKGEIGAIVKKSYDAIIGKRND